MSLLNQLIKESASAGASSAGGIANSRDSLFGGGSGDSANTGVTKMMKRMGFIDLSEIPSKKNKKKWMKMVESTTTYDSEMKSYDYNDVMSKLNQAAKTAKNDGDVAVFGVEDDEGAIVKIYVPTDQAEEFQVALAELLAGESEMSPTGEYEAVSSKDIAEIVYDLKTKFDIIDADWGEIQGTEEEEVEGDVVAGDAVEDDLEGGEDLEGEDLEGGDDLGGEDEAQAMTALQAVIQALQGDAEAKKAEAEARKMEAEAKIAQYSADAAMAKVKQEEDIMDMEQHEKAQKDAKKEAETLAKLAKYRKETDEDDVDVDSSDFVSDQDVDDFKSLEGSDLGDDLEDVPEPSKEEEEQSDDIPELNKDKLIELIFKSLSANG